LSPHSGDSASGHLTGISSLVAVAIADEASSGCFPFSFFFFRLSLVPSLIPSPLMVGDYMVKVNGFAGFKLSFSK
ncbi:hypothetical protein SCA6_003992, partial [Theobroma cacao]